MFNRRILTPLITGAVIGALLTLAANEWLGRRHIYAELKGAVEIETASWDDDYLMNAIYLEPSMPIYLKFNNDRDLNAYIGKSVRVSGIVRTVTLNDGSNVLELRVVNLRERSD